ncbi:MAG: hypothetical protein M3O82_08355, partial [Verrucomicrobiota bacterium]|nr:hypothetical protein [Verrucomicrobiota bacterium]
MDREAAKVLLECYRPGGADANDPTFAEALREVQSDPELAQWFANQQAFDSVIVGKLAHLPAPPLPEAFSFRQKARETALPVRRFAPVALALAAALALS